MNRLLFNWQIKAMALTFAICTYLVVSAIMIDERVVSIPVNVILPENLETKSNLPESVKVIISGESDVIYIFNPESIKATVDFSGVTTPGIAISPVILETSALFMSEKEITCTADPSQFRVLFGEK